MHPQPHSSFIIHHSSSFITIHLHIFSSILFWSTPSCFSFGPPCHLVKVAVLGHSPVSGSQIQVPVGRLHPLFSAQVIIKYYPGFEDPFSPDYVQNPFLLSLCGSAVAFIMAFPFMMIFDTVSDTILFAYIVQKMREEKQEEHTIYTCACGLVHTVDDFMGLGCLDQRQKDRIRLETRLLQACAFCVTN